EVQQVVEARIAEDHRADEDVHGLLGSAGGAVLEQFAHQWDVGQEGNRVHGLVLAVVGQPAQDDRVLGRHADGAHGLGLALGRREVGGQFLDSSLAKRAHQHLVVHTQPVFLGDVRVDGQLRPGVDEATKAGQGAALALAGGLVRLLVKLADYGRGVVLNQYL